MSARVNPSSDRPFPDGARYHKYGEPVGGYLGFYTAYADGGNSDGEPIAFLRDDPESGSPVIEPVGNPRHAELNLPTTPTADPIIILPENHTPTAPDGSQPVLAAPEPGTESAFVQAPDAATDMGRMLEIPRYSVGHVLTEEDVANLHATAALVSALCESSIKMEQTYADLTQDSNAARTMLVNSLNSAAVKIGSAPLRNFSTGELREVRHRFVEEYKNATTLSSIVASMLKLARIFV